MTHPERTKRNRYGKRGAIAMAFILTLNTHPAIGGEFQAFPLPKLSQRFFENRQGTPEELKQEWDAVRKSAEGFVNDRPGKEGEFRIPQNPDHIRPHTLGDEVRLGAFLKRDIEQKWERVLRSGQRFPSPEVEECTRAKLRENNIGSTVEAFYLLGIETVEQAVRTSPQAEKDYVESIIAECIQRIPLG